MRTNHVKDDEDEEPPPPLQPPPKRGRWGNSMAAAQAAPLSVPQDKVLPLRHLA